MLIDQIGKAPQQPRPLCRLHRRPRATLEGTAKTFDAYAGEVIKVVAVYDPTSTECELLDTVRADDLPDAEPHEAR